MGLHNTYAFNASSFKSPPETRRVLGHAAFKQGDLIQVHHWDISDDIGKSFVEQWEYGHVQSRPGSLKAARKDEATR